LLWIGDSPGACTGPGRLGEELLPRLAEVYEIAALGWPLPPPAAGRGYTVLEPDSEPWSLDRVAAVRAEFQPDLIVTLGDPEKWLPLAATSLRHYAAWMGAGPIPAGPVPVAWRSPLASLDERVVFGASAQAWLTETLPHLPATVVPVGVETQRFHPLPTREKLRAEAGLAGAFVIGCVARNEPRQHLPRLLEAVARLREERDDVFLYLHTDPDDVGGDLISQVNRYGLSGGTGFSVGVTAWTGVSLAELNEIYNLCDVLVLPGAGLRYGLTLLEGLAAGVPVLTGAGGLAEDLLPPDYPRLRNQTYLTHPETGQREPLLDVDHLVAELRDLAENPAHRAALVEQGLAHVPAFSWDRAVEGWKQALARAWEQSPRPRLFPVGRPPARKMENRNWRMEEGEGEIENRKSKVEPPIPNPQTNSLRYNFPISNLRLSLLLWADAPPEAVLECLETVWAQEVEDLEVWILDPGRSLKLIHALRPLLPERPLHYLSVLERGPIAAFNVALRRATGDLLGLWTAEQLFYPCALQRVLEAFSIPAEGSRPGGASLVDLVAGETEFGGRHTGLARPVALPPIGHWPLAIGHSPSPPPTPQPRTLWGSEHHLFFRRRVWEELGDLLGLHPAAALVDYQLRALQVGFQLRYLEFVLAQRQVLCTPTRSEAETRELHLAYVQTERGKGKIEKGKSKREDGTSDFRLPTSDLHSPISNLQLPSPDRPPFVSVVLPTYNQASMLPEALASVQAQTYAHWELIVVNDGSTDDTETVLSQFQDPRLTVVSLRQNRGIPGALNEGFRRARGDYVTFTSSDNLLHPRLLERLVAALEENPQAGVAYADYEETGGRRSRRTRKWKMENGKWKMENGNPESGIRSNFQSPISLAGVTPEDIAERGWSLGPAFLIRASVLDEHGWPPYDETLAGIEDTALWLDLSRRTLFHHVPEVLYTYRRHPGQATARLERTGGYEPLRAALRQRQARHRLGLNQAPGRSGKSGRWRILFLYRHACHGGVEVALWHLLPALAEQGFEAEICFLTDQGGAALFKDVCPVHVLGTDKPRKALPRLRRVLAAGGFDLLHQIAVPWATDALPGTGFTGPVIAGCHGNADLLQGVTARNTDALLLVSEALREAARAVVPDLEARVIPNGLDLSRFGWERREMAQGPGPRADCQFPSAPVPSRPSPVPLEVDALRRRERLPADRRLIAWVGRLGPEKNWPFFLTTLQALLSHRHDVAGVLVGGGEADQHTQHRLAAQVEAAGLAPHFFWRPTLSPQEMPAFYGLVASTRGLLLSTSQEEAFGLTLLEAMASGVPVVAPAVGGIPEVVRRGDTGTLLPPDASVGDWVQAIEALLDDEERYRRRADRGRTWVAERFDVRAVATRHAILYERLLDAKKPPGVVILAGTVWTETGGGQRPRKLAETLARMGYRVLFLQQFGPAAESWGYVDVQATQAVTRPRWRARAFPPEEQQAIAEEVRDLLRAYSPRLVINCVCTELARLQMAACQRLGARAIYDCMDDWGAFARMQEEAYGEDSGYAEEIERQLCQQADRVAVTTPALARRLAELGCPPEKQVWVPNGLDSSFPRRRRGPRPPDLPPPPPPPELGGGEGGLKGRRGCVLGYTGCLWGEWQDWDLVRTLALARPAWTFVLLGPYAGHLDEFFADTPNVFFLGPRPHARLHEYIDHFDVGLIPFKAGDFAQTISPLKVFDYLARGKPVVHPPMEALEGFPFTWTATTPAEWLAALDEALSTPPDRAALAAFLAGHTWEQRLRTMLGPWWEELTGNP